jgi:hypothetical protein
MELKMLCRALDFGKLQIEGRVTSSALSLL